MRRNTRYDLNCLQNEICVLQISIFPVEQKTRSNVVKNSARAVESLKSTNFVVPFVKNRWRRIKIEWALRTHKFLVCAQRPLEFDATPPIFQKRYNKIGRFCVAIVFDKK